MEGFYSSGVWIILLIVTCVTISPSGAIVVIVIACSFTSALSGILGLRVQGL